MDLVWVDFDLGVPPCCSAAQPFLISYHQLSQNGADSETLKIQVKPTQSTSIWDAMFITTTLLGVPKFARF